MPIWPSANAAASILGAVIAGGDFLAEPRHTSWELEHTCAAPAIVAGHVVFGVEDM